MKKKHTIIRHYSDGDHSIQHFDDFSEAESFYSGKYCSQFICKATWERNGKIFRERENKVSKPKESA